MIINLIKKFKNRLIWATVFSAISSAISIFLLATINNNINLDKNQNITELVSLFLLLIVALFSISFFSQYLLAKLGTNFVYHLRSFLLKQVSKVNYQNLEKVGGHRVLATLTTDVTSISHALAILPVFAVNFATIIFCFIYLYIQSAVLFSFLILSLLLGVGGAALIMRIGRQKFYELREKEDDLYAVFKTLVDGNKELNINKNRRDFFYEQQAQPCIDEVRAIDIKAKTYWVLSESMLRSLIFLALGIVFFVSHIYFQVETVVLTSFILFTTYIIGPISFIQSTYQSLVRGRIAYHKIQALDLNFDEDLEQESGMENLAQWNELKFENVSYQYPSKTKYKFSIGPIDLSIKQGENIFICGGNGSGKSTFAKLLVGLYHPQSGHIQLGSEIIKDDNRQWFRNHFATIFSDFFLFDHVLNDQGQLVVNGELDKLLKKLELADKVAVVNGQISSTQLSQGQRKRLAMLLAYAEDSSIYLFDEWAADQDPTFRAYFYEELLPELKAKGKTLVVITHDDKYFHLADRLIKFENGQISMPTPTAALIPVKEVQ